MVKWPEVALTCSSANGKETEIYSRTFLDLENIRWVSMQKRMLGIRDQRGFTLIEIIMIIVLLLIIAAIAILRYNDMKDKANDATASGIVCSIVASTAIGYADKAVNTSASTYPTQEEVNTTYFNKGVANLTDGGAYWTASFCMWL
jgi:prepilin-type N-terminal cleavage/methylation domain-containing protein